MLCLWLCFGGSCVLCVCGYVGCVFVYVFVAVVVVFCVVCCGRGGC